MAKKYQLIEHKTTILALFQLYQCWTLTRHFWCEGGCSLGKMGETRKDVSVWGWEESVRKSGNHQANILLKYKNKNYKKYSQPNNLKLCLTEKAT